MRFFFLWARGAWLASGAGGGGGYSTCLDQATRAPPIGVAVVNLNVLYPATWRDLYYNESQRMSKLNTRVLSCLDRFGLVYWGLTPQQQPGSVLIPTHDVSSST